jgi:D-alanine-D-alanine ligase
LPGFTSISMYPMLWKACGLDIPELLDTLIDQAMTRYR